MLHVGIMFLYKNSQKRFIVKGFTYFVTTVTKYRYPYFRSKVLCELFVHELRALKLERRCMLFGFVILYDHVHLLIQPQDDSTISKDIHFLKRHFSRNANILMGYTRSPGRAVGQPRVQVQPRAQIDQFVQKYQNHKSIKTIPKFRWHKSYHDHYIRNKHDFENHMYYISNNHIKHNLRNDWKYVGYNFDDITDQ
jgi:REP element-mobilizing transposase RayT